MSTRMALCSTLLLLLCVGVPCRAQRPAMSPEVAKKRSQRVIEITNRERVMQGLPPLKRHEVLCQAATWMAKDMAENRYFAHQDKQGRTVGLRLQDFGYQKLRSIGENIAAGQEEPRDVVTEWIKSPSHRANLFGKTYREIGVGYVASPKGEYESYWVQDFGMRSRIYPVIINEEHAETDNPKVQLYIYGEGWAAKMRVSNDKEHWSAWEPYKADKEWDLEPGEGKRTVYVELQNDDGDTQISEDGIDLVTKDKISPAPTSPKKTPEKQVEPPKKEPAKQEEPVKKEPVKKEEPKKEEPKPEPVKKEEPQKEEPKPDPPKKEPPKKEEEPPKKEEPKKEPPKKEEPKKEPPKKEPVPDC